MFAVAQITAKGQTSISQEVRAALHVAPGAPIAWQVRPDGTATMRRVQPVDIEYLCAVASTLSEWASQADEDAYRAL